MRPHQWLLCCDPEVPEGSRECVCGLFIAGVRPVREVWPLIVSNCLGPQKAKPLLPEKSFFDMTAPGPIDLTMRCLNQSAVNRADINKLIDYLKEKENSR